MSLKKFFITFLVTTIMLSGLSALVLYLSFSNSSIPGIIPSKATMSGRTNILVMGTDPDGQNSDSMLFVSIGHDENTVDIMTIPRDTRILMDGYYCKINAAHAVGGEEKAVEVVEELLGTDIPYYVSFNTAVFREMIDALGGVYFDVPERMQYSDPYQDLYIDLYPGYQLLDGEHAEQLVRYRQYTFGDMDRTAVQRDFIKALVEQKLNMSLITKIDDLYDLFSDKVITNMPLSDMVKIAASVRSLNMDNFRTHVLPCELADIDGISYVLTLQDQLDQVMVDYFGEEIPGVVKTPEDQLGSGDQGNGIVTEEQADPYGGDEYYEDTGYYDEYGNYYEDAGYYDEYGNYYAGE